MNCGRCGFWYCGECYNTSEIKDVLDNACTSFTPFNKEMYVAIKNGNIDFIQKNQIKRGE